MTTTTYHSNDTDNDCDDGDDDNDDFDVEHGRETCRLHRFSDQPDQCKCLLLAILVSVR